MSGVLQIREAVIAALEAAGLTAVAAYQGKAKHHTGPVAAVDVAAVSTREAGFGSYLGLRESEVDGGLRELYGRQMEAEILLEVRSAQADECEQGMETAAQALLERLPSGLRPGALSWEPVSWDEDNRLFLRQGKVHCRAFFTAELNPEDGTLLNFILKGVVSV